MDSVSNYHQKVNEAYKWSPPTKKGYTKSTKMSRKCKGCSYKTQDCIVNMYFGRGVACTSCRSKDEKCEFASHSEKWIVHFDITGETKEEAEFSPYEESDQDEEDSGARRYRYILPKGGFPQVELPVVEGKTVNIDNRELKVAEMSYSCPRSFKQGDKSIVTQTIRNGSIVSTACTVCRKRRRPCVFAGKSLQSIDKSQKSGFIETPEGEVKLYRRESQSEDSTNDTERCRTTPELSRQSDERTIPRIDEYLDVDDDDDFVQDTQFRNDPSIFEQDDYTT